MRFKLSSFNCSYTTGPKFHDENIVAGIVRKNQISTLHHRHTQFLQQFFASIENLEVSEKRSRLYEMIDEIKVCQAQLRQDLERFEGGIRSILEKTATNTSETPGLVANVFFNFIVDDKHKLYLYCNALAGAITRDENLINQLKRQLERLKALDNEKLIKA